MPIAWEKIEPLLMHVLKPARYVGGEFNQLIKPTAAVRCCLAFPDVYEIGMSYHGFRLLYERINSHETWAAERAYAPWPDFEALLREHHIPLYSLETRRGLAEFDWIGFTLQHESNFTNVLSMIDLAGLPLESKDRQNGQPILIGGGEGAYSPEPLSPFLDAFVIGDGEEVVVELMTLFERAKAGAWDRCRILLELSRLPSVYVPAFYQVDYHEDGRVRQVRPVAPAPGEAPPPPVISKRHYNVAGDLGATRPVVPLVRSVHDRLAIEVRRGCVNGCRFCQAGMINRPVNERSVAQIVEIARKGVEATGYDEVSLLSLSSADYTLITPLVQRLTDEFTPQGISISLPSLRINGFDISLVDQIASVRKSGFTFAPEAGTARLRNVINKPVDQDYFYQMIEDVFRRGWQTVKFYFMIGLPTETDADLDGIVEICQRAAELGWKYHRKRAAINVTLSPFIPKSNTPFQWEGQIPREELRRRYQYVCQAVEEKIGRVIEVKSADIGASFIEAVLARGDRRLGAVIRRAWELGARFDGWAEHFNLATWLQAFEELGLDPAFYANRERGEDEILPFAHISSNVGSRFLLDDRRRAWREGVKEKCDTGGCSCCDVCGGEIQHSLARDMEEDDSAVAAGAPASLAESSDEAPASEPPAHAPVTRGKAAHVSPFPVQRMRLTFSRLGGLRFLSHLDFGKVLFMILRRAQIPMAYTQGFNPLPRVQYAPPLSLGMGGEHELVDLMLVAHVSPDYLLGALRRIGLTDLTFLKAEEVSLRDQSLEIQISASRYRIEMINEEFAEAADTLEELVREFLLQRRILVDVEKKNGLRQMDLKQAVLEIEVDRAAQEGWIHPFTLNMAINHAEGFFVKPHHVTGFLLGRPIELGRDVRITRTGFLFHEA